MDKRDVAQTRYVKKNINTSPGHRQTRSVDSVQGTPVQLHMQSESGGAVADIPRRPQIEDAVLMLID